MQNLQGLHARNSQKFVIYNSVLTEIPETPDKNRGALLDFVIAFVIRKYTTKAQLDQYSICQRPGGDSPRG